MNEKINEHLLTETLFFINFSAECNNILSSTQFSFTDTAVGSWMRHLIGILYISCHCMLVHYVGKWHKVDLSNWFNNFRN